MVTHIKGGVFVLKGFQLYFKFLSIDFCIFFKYLRSLTFQWNEQKNGGGGGGHPVCALLTGH